MGDGRAGGDCNVSDESSVNVIKKKKKKKSCICLTHSNTAELRRWNIISPGMLPDPQICLDYEGILNHGRSMFAI